MKLERISLWQFALLTFISRSVLTVAELPIRSAGRDAWLATILFIVLGIPLIYFYNSLARRFPDRNVFEYAVDLLGPWLGRLVTLPLLWGFLHFSAFVLRVYGEMIVTAVLPQTPLVVIMGGMIFVCAVGVRSGLHALGRAAEILVPLFVVGIVGVLLFALPDAHLDRLQPVASDGAEPILAGTLHGGIFFFFYAVVLVIYPAVRDKERLNRAAISATLAAGALITAAAVVAVAVFGPHELKRLAFPFLHLSRNIRVAQFVERIETVAIAAWGVGLFLELTLVYHAAARGLGVWLGVKRDYRLVLPMGSVLLTLALILFPSSFEFREFFRIDVIVPYALFLILWVPIVLWTAILLGAGRRGNRRGERRGKRAPWEAGR